MATLQKFKLFATQCAAVNIPTQSPTTSPLLLLRRRPRRKTLRMLFLARRPQISDSDHQPNNPPPPPPSNTAPSIQRRLKLKDLFFSSTSPTSHAHNHLRDRQEEEVEEASSGIGPVRSDRETGPSNVVRPLYQPFRCRNRLLLRKAWRPVLTTIDEIQD